jgi:hypothetical protein
MLMGSMLLFIMISAEIVSVVIERVYFLGLKKRFL